MGRKTRRKYTHNYHYISDDDKRDDYDTNWELLISNLRNQLYDVLEEYRQLDPRLEDIYLPCLLDNQVPSKIPVIGRTNRYHPYELEDDEYIREFILEVRNILNNCRNENRHKEPSEICYNYQFQTKEEKELNPHKNLIKSYSQYRDIFHSNLSINDMYKRISIKLH